MRWPDWNAVAIAPQALETQVAWMRNYAPAYAAIADRVAANLKRVTPGGQTIHADALEWLAIIQLVQGLLTVFSSQCGANATPEKAAAWISNRPAFRFRRVRLRMQIRRNWPEAFKWGLPNVVAAIENACDDVTATTYAALTRQSIHLPASIVR